jgi:RNA polymerase sigma-70 factor (ECF subfamily)
LSQISVEIEQLIAAGAKRLRARATNTREVDAAALVGRTRAVVEKYLLKEGPTPTGEKVTEFLDKLHADDLCLVLACERGDQFAWNDLVEGYGATVRSAARAAASNEDMAEDLAQSIWAELHGLKAQQDGRPSGKLGYYSGVGSLGGWLRAVVGQLAIDQHRKLARLVQPEEDAEIDRLSRDSSPKEDAFSTLHSLVNPEQAFVNNVAAAEVETALTYALAELDDEDRLLVKLYYFDGLRLREAGAMLGVHEATASRRLARIHSEVRACVGTILIRDHGWTESETQQYLAEVAVSLQTNVEPMLASASPAESSLQSSEV